MTIDRDVIKPRCESDSLTLPEECGADAGGDTSRCMNVRLSARLLITVALPTAQSQTRNVKNQPGEDNGGGSRPYNCRLHVVSFLRKWLVTESVSCLENWVHSHESGSTSDHADCLIQGMAMPISASPPLHFV